MIEQSTEVGTEVVPKKRCSNGEHWSNPEGGKYKVTFTKRGKQSRWVCAKCIAERAAKGYST